MVLAAESLNRGASGIGRVARLMARVLADGAFDGRALALRGADGSPLPATSMHGSKLAMLAATHALAASTDAYVFDFAGLARARVGLPGLRRPALCWMHGIEVWQDARPDHLRALRACDLVLVNSRYTLERARSLHGGFEHARVCWLGTEEDRPAPTADLEGPPTVLIVGRIDAREDYKGHRELIDAWPQVVAAVPNARLVIAGDGSGRAALQRLAGASAVGDRIELTGFVPDAELDALWQRATVFAMPSRGEGFGLTYIEAMRRGVPVLASVHDAAPEINLHGVTGYNVDLDRDGELAERIVELLRDRDHARGLGRAGQARWAEHFRYGAFRARLHRWLRQLTGEPAAERVS